MDNNKSRQLFHRVFYQAKELIYIDGGNGEYTGQVVCGVRRGGKTYYPPIGEVNITAATAVVNMIYNILAVGDSTVRKVTFSTVPK